MRFLSAAALSLAALPAMAEVPQVVTDIPPVHALVAQVMGDLGTPELLLEKGADEHDFQLRPSQMRGISDADLVVWIGPELTPWLDRAMAGSTAVSMKLLQAPGTVLQDMAEAHDHDDHADHEAPAEGENHDAHEGHDDHDDHGGLDPHAWLNPDNAVKWLDVIAGQLADLDPEHADRYRENAALAQSGIAAMDTEIKAQLAPVQNRGILTYHAAFGYFATHYGLTAVEALAMGDAAAPGAAGVAQITEEAKADSFACAFPEVQHAPGLLEQVVAGTTTKIGGALDPAGSSLDFGPAAYEALMRNIATTMVDCLAQ